MTAYNEAQRFQHYSVTASAGQTSRLSPVPFERIDDYAVVARLGQGGMAEVFLALSLGPSGFRKLVAIKRLHRHLQDDPASVELFLLEASLAARLQHPNVVQTHKVGTFEGQHFIAMEYLDGQPLNRVLNRLRSQEAHMHPSLAAHFISDALDGLHYAHEARDYDGRPLGVIHRDVSPHNIFITFDGQVKLLDFGVARIGEPEAYAQGGVINGKFAYMAPEQALGERVDRRADVWGMGTTLWECLAGQRLFRGGSDVSVMQSSLTEDIPWVTDIAPEVPEQLARIVDKALQRDVDRRHRNALEFKEELDQWLFTQRSSRSRVAISATMRSLFIDTIERRRETLRECLSRVDGSDGFVAKPSVIDPPAPSVSVPSIPSVPPPLPQRTAAPATSGSVIDRALPKVFAFSMGAALAVAAGMLLGHYVMPRTTIAAEERSSAGQAPFSPGMAPLTPVSARPAGAAQAESPRLEAPAAIAPPLELKPPVVVDRELATSRDRQRDSRERSKKQTDLPRDASSADDRLRMGVTEAAGSESAAVAQGTGRLVLDSVPYSVVTLDGKRLGITPIDVELPATTHTLALRNPEKGIETRYRVTVPAGARIEKRVVIEE